MPTCPHCKRNYPDWLTPPIHCCGGLIEFPQAEFPDWSATVPHPVRENLWIQLHEFAPNNCSNWNPEKTRTWFNSWEQRIPGCCSQNWRNYRDKLAFPDTSDPHEFFAWTVSAHNYVSRNHAEPRKPRLSLAEAYAIFWPQPQPAFALPFLTSLSPQAAAIPAQRKALQSWQRFGAQIYSQNRTQEIPKLKSIYPEVHHWIANDRRSELFPCDNQMIIELLANIKTLGRLVIINADVEARGLQSQLPTESSWIGIRWNYKNGYASAKEFEWGLDVFCLDAEDYKKLPPNLPHVIGKPAWDYVIPTICETPILHSRCFFHQGHAQNWKQEEWHTGTAWMAENGYPHFWAQADLRRGWEKDWSYDERLGQYIKTGVASDQTTQTLSLPAQQATHSRQISLTHSDASATEARP